MARKRGILEPRPWIKGTALLVWWISSLLVLMSLSADNDLNRLHNQAINHRPELRPLRNEIRGLRYTRWDPQGDYRPIRSVYFENLRVENNDLGIFKTALHKVARIRDLELEFYRHTSRGATLTSASDIHSVGKDTGAGAGGSVFAQVRGLLRSLTTPRRGWHIDNIHLSNVSEVYVDDFDYKVFCDGDLHLGIQSRRAIVSYKWSDIFLRGRVTIRTGDGSTLEGNNVKWDVGRQHFSVRGVYVLNRGGTITTGKDICVDAQLNGVKAQDPEVEGKENKECFARL